MEFSETCEEGMETNDTNPPKDATARRRKIAEKGLDRMALITGRSPIPQIPPPDSQSHHTYTSSCPPSIDQLLPPDEDTDTTSKGAGNKAQPVLRRCETKVHPSRQSASEPNETKTSEVTSTDQNPPISTVKNAPKPDLLNYLCKTISPNYLRPAIIASQETRRRCSIIAAFIALLSYIGFPILGKPLLLLQLTNMTIVVAPLLKDTLQKAKQEASSGSSSTGEAEFPDHVGLALAWGMFLQTSLKAFFMDSSIYSVVVICGVSFLQKLGF